MSFLSRLKQNIGVEEEEEDEFEEEEPKRKKIKVEKVEKIKSAGKKIKKILKKKKQKKEEDEIEDEIEDEDADESNDEELDEEAEKELEELLGDEEFEEEEGEEERKETEKISETKKPDFSLKNLGGPEGELAVDVYQTAKDVVIEAAIAGIDSDQLDVFIESDTVTIKGEREGCAVDQDKSYFYQECYWGAFQRRIILPEEVDASRGKAELKKGILCIRIPKTERKKRRKIDVRE
jgi:HSP20 family protein